MKHLMCWANLKLLQRRVDLSSKFTVVFLLFALRAALAGVDAQATRVKFWALWLGAQRTLICAQAWAGGGSRGEFLPNGEHKPCFIHAAFPPIIGVRILIDRIQRGVGLFRWRLFGLLEWFLLTPGFKGLALQFGPLSQWTQVGSGPARIGFVPTLDPLQFKITQLLQTLLCTGAQRALLGLGQNALQALFLPTLWHRHNGIAPCARIQEPANKDKSCCHGSRVKHLTPLHQQKITGLHLDSHYNPQIAGRVYYSRSIVISVKETNCRVQHHGQGNANYYGAFSSSWEVLYLWHVQVTLVGSLRCHIDLILLFELLYVRL